MSDSAPWSEKRFCPTYRVWRKTSKASASSKSRRSAICTWVEALVLWRPRFEPTAHPVPDARILDVLELGADGVGVDFLESRDHLAQAHSSCC